MTPAESVSDLRYLFRKQKSTGIWTQEHGPFKNQAAAEHAAFELNPIHKSRIELVVGICTSEDGREVITEYPK